MKRITSTDLANWASTRNCQENLPLLIRKLIRVSPAKDLKLLIPAGDNIILPGYDGLVECTEGSENVPDGKSVWELGSNAEFQKKATGDFKKRTNAIDSNEIEATTFVFVTPRVWSNKDTWIKRKKQSSKWKDIIVIDGQVLEEWIELYPSVGAWLSKFLQLPFGNITALEEFWQVWSRNIKYRIPSTLVVSGREKQVEELHTFLANKPNILSIKAASLEEVLAFIAAAVEGMDDELKEEVFAKAIIIENEQDFEAVAVYKSPMLLIAKFEAGTIIDQAVINGHHVILPLSNDVTASSVQVELPRIRRQSFEEGLQKIGFNYDEAEKLIRDSGQSLSVLRRLLNFERNQQPAWAKNGYHVDIVPALLVGRWSEEKEGDTVIISLLADEPYEKYVTRLSRWKLEKDSPFIHIKSIWRLTSVLDAWSILSKFVTKPHLDNFRTVFLKVILEINAALELEPAKHYLASLYGKEPNFSYFLKEGLCQSLIMIAIFGDQFGLSIPNSSQGFADNLIHEVLFEANGETWCSLYQLLPLLAEASPDSFLRSVENSLNKENSPVMEMFSETYDPFLSANYYIGLLWALENLLFSEEYFLRTVLALSHLSRLDPGGKLSNRPINSLKQVFTPWYRQTKAELDLKKYTLEKVVEREPEIAWQILQSCTPKRHAVASPLHKCKWRFDTQHLKREVTNQEIWDFNSFVLSKLLLLAEGDEKKTASLVDLYPNLSSTDRDKLLHFLIESKRKHEHTEGLVWNELRDLITRHKAHGEQHWALQVKDLDKLEEVYKIYTPDNLGKKYQYLFETGWRTIPEVIGKKFSSLRERESLIDEHRQIAFHKIYLAERLTGILKLATDLENVSNLARTAAKYPLNKEEEKMILSHLADNKEGKLKSFVQQYIFYKTIAGPEWGLFAWNHVKSKFSDEELLSDFLLSLPQTRGNADLAEEASESISKLYWQKVNFHAFGSSTEERLYAIDKLQLVNRHITVLNEISYFVQEIPTDEIYNVLLKAATIDSEEEARIMSYNVGVIFNELYSRDNLEEEKIVQLEWLYVTILADFSNESKPKFLHQNLTTNPNFFVEVVSQLYFSDSKSEEAELSEAELMQWYRRSGVVRELMDSWRTIPGTKEDGTIEKEVLWNWITTARNKAIEVNRIYGVNSEIGNLLACYQRNDVYWPSEEICEVIDKLDNKDINTHFETEIFNSRGFYVKAAYEGGDQERVLAGYFERMGKQILSKYPITASILLGLARNYRNTSKGEDDDSYLDELR